MQKTSSRDQLFPTAEMKGYGYAGMFKGKEPPGFRCCHAARGGQVGHKCITHDPRNECFAGQTLWEIVRPQRLRAKGQILDWNLKGSREVPQFGPQC